MKLSIVAGATSQSVNVFVRDSSSTTGAGLAAVAPAGGSLLTGTKLYYSFTGANASAGVAVSLSVLAAVNSSYSSAGIVTLDGTNMIGWVRIDIPNAALATSKGRVVSFHLYGGTNMAPTPFEIELTGWDNQDGVRGGMTSLPNGTGLNTIFNTDYTTVYDSTNKAFNSKLGNFAMGGSSLNLSLGTLATSGTTTFNAFTVTNDFTVSGAMTLTGTVTAINASNAITGIDVVKIRGTTSAGTAGYVGVDWGQVINQGSVVDLSGTTVSESRYQGIIHTGNAQVGGGISSIKLDAGASSEDDAYKGMWISGSFGGAEPCQRLITAYNGTTKIASVTPNFTGLPASGNAFVIERRTWVSGAVNVTLADTVTTLTSLPAITADWITAAGIAADAGTEIGTAVWASATRTLTALGFTLGDVTLAASQPNYAPSKAGDAMTLTAAYDAAKTATQTEPDNAGISAIEAKTTQLTFTTPNVVDASAADKTGYKLASDGLDAISVADPGSPASQTTFPKRMIALWRRFFSKVVKDNAIEEIRQYADDDTTVNSTQDFNVTATTETIGKAS